MSNAPAGGLYAADSMRKLAHAGGAASVVLQVQVNAAGPIFRYARIVVTYIGPS